MHAVYLYRWTSTHPPGQAGKSSKFARHSPEWARVWPADEEKRPVSDGQQR
jgi:hypothetical protein